MADDFNWDSIGEAVGSAPVSSLTDWDSIGEAVDPAPRAKTSPQFPYNADNPPYNDDSFVAERQTVNGVEYRRHAKTGGIYDPDGNLTSDPTVLQAFGKDRPTKAAQRVIDAKSALDRANPQQGWVERFVTGPLGRGKNQSLDPALDVGLFLTGQTSPQEFARGVVQNANEAAQYPRDPADEAVMQQISQAPGYWEAAKIAAMNPQVVLQTGAESLPAMGAMAAGSMAGGVAGSVLPGPGTALGAAAGAGLASGYIEFTNSLVNAITDTGKPLTEENVLAAVNDPAIMAKAKAYALRRGVAVGVFDAISAGVAGRIAKPLQTLTKTGEKLPGRILGATGEVATQGALGAGGEYTGQKLTGENKPGEVVMEGVGELVTAPVEIAQAVAARELPKGRETAKPAEMKATLNEMAGPLAGTPVTIISRTADGTGFNVRLPDGRETFTGVKTLTMGEPAQIEPRLQSNPKSAQPQQTPNTTPPPVGTAPMAPGRFQPVRPNPPAAQVQPPAPTTPATSPAPAAPPQNIPAGPAIWANKDSDLPVTVTDAAPQKGSDGRLYQPVLDSDGKPSFVPLDELKPAPIAPETPAQAALPDAPVPAPQPQENWDDIGVKVEAPSAPVQATDAAQPASIAAKPETQPTPEQAPTADSVPPPVTAGHVKAFDAYMASRKPVSEDAIAKVLGGDRKAAGRLISDAIQSRRLIQSKTGKLFRAPQRVKPNDALAFIASIGGIQDPTGELAAMDLPKMGPYGPVVRKDGLHPDKVREALVEADYMRDAGRDSGGQAQSTVADLYDFIDQAARKKVYHPNDQAKIDAIEAERKAAIEQDAIANGWTPPRQRNMIERHYGADVDAALFKAVEEMGVRVSLGELDQAAQLVTDGLDPENALEAAIVRATENELEAAREDPILRKLLSNDDRRIVDAWDVAMAFASRARDVESAVKSEPATNETQQAGSPETRVEPDTAGEQRKRPDAEETAGAGGEAPRSGETGGEKQPAAIENPASTVNTASQQTTDEGSFGPVLKGFEGRWRDAALKLEELQTGEAPGALSHKDIGPIALVWGKAGTRQSDGYGLAKIIAWHPEVLDDLQSNIDRMSVTSRNDNRIQLESEADRAGVRLEWDGQQKTWLIGAYRKDVPRLTEKFTGSLRELWGNLAQSPRRGEANIEEVGADGKPQTVLPGAEQATAEEVKKAKADDKAAKELELRRKQSKLRKGNQKPVEEQAGGMFAGQGEQQTSLLDKPAEQPSLVKPETTENATSNTEQAKPKPKSVVDGVRIKQTRGFKKGDFVIVRDTSTSMRNPIGGMAAAGGEYAFYDIAQVEMATREGEIKTLKSVKYNSRYFPSDRAVFTRVDVADPDYLRETENAKDGGVTFDSFEAAQSAAKATRPDAKAQKSAAKPTEAKIEDFGEKILGARKDAVRDIVKTLSDDVDIATEPLSKVFPQPDYEKMAEAGVDRKALALVALMRAQIPTKPKTAWKVKGWTDKVQVMRDFAQKLLSGQYTPDEVMGKLDVVTSLTRMSNTAKVIADIEPRYLAYAANWSITKSQVSMLNGVTYKPAKTFYMLENDKQRWTNVQAETLEDVRQPALDYIRAKAQAELDTQTKRYTPLNIYTDRFTKEVFIGFKGLTGVVRLKSGFASVKDARLYQSDQKDALQAQIDAMREGPDMRRAANAPRSGPPRRVGDATPAIFQEAFGFRGVQFGNYVEEDRRQSDLNEAFDALMDLSDVLGIPPRALSLNGQLGLAFGARGKGGPKAAMAHYEPGQVVINLTKNAGAGSLAHEWFHAVDNYFAKQNKGTGFISEARNRSDVREPVWNAWKAIERTLKTGDFAKRSAELDESRSKPYWNTTIEKAARAFERYVVDRLAEKQTNNDYLANLNLEGGAYPTAKEMQEQGIRKAYDDLFAAMEVKPGENGNLILGNTGRMSEDAEGSRFAADFMRELAQDDTLFRYPVSPSPTLEQVLADIDPTIQARGAFMLSEDDRKFGAIRKRRFVSPSADPRKQDNEFFVLEDGDGQIWLDISRYETGKGGSSVYAAIANYAHNAGKVFIGDPAGLSDDALIRRTEAMLSSALKFGTTRHIEPHPRQLRGDAKLGIPPLEWTYGDDVANVESLIRASTANLNALLPEIKNARYDFQTRTFRTGQGEQITDGMLRDWRHTYFRIGEARAGRATLKRGILLNTLLRAPSGERPGLLELVLRQSRRLVDQGGLKGLLYNLSSPAPVFYSALLRTVENLKQEKAPAAQWLNTIRNQPGVKPEEVAWLGLEDWLNAQTGSVTRQQIADFVRANQVQVSEVQKGARAPLTVAEQAELDDLNRRLAEGDRTLTAMDAMRAGELSMARVALPDAFAQPKFSQYQLPGGENYRELLLTLPTKPDTGNEGPAGWAETGNARSRAGDQNYRSPHWAEPNVLAHVRFNERTDADGKKVLFIEEIQSDWHQAGRKKGYATLSGPTEEQLSDARVRLSQLLEDADYLGFDNAAQARTAILGHDDWAERWDVSDMPELIAAGNEYRRLTDHQKRAKIEIPDAPFKTSWPELAMKRMIRWAAENGFDRIAWTPGDVQAERYDLSKQISEVSALRTSPTGTTLGMRYSLNAKDHRGNVVLDRSVLNAEEAADYVGKEVAEKLFGGENAKILDRGQVAKVSGLDLKIGGEGMKGFYDKILVDTANKLGKKFGAKVGRTEVEATSFGKRGRPAGWDVKDGAFLTVHSLDVTPAMRTAAMEGVPLFNNKLPPTAFIASKKQIAAVNVRAQALARRILGHSVRVEVFDRMPSFVPKDYIAAYNPSERAIYLSMKAAHDLAHNIGHESLHHLRLAGAFTKSEWKVLVTAARKAADGTLNNEAARYETYKTEYREKYGMSDAQFADLIEEEMVADLLGAFVSKRESEINPQARSILKKIVDFIEGLWRLMENTLGLTEPQTMAEAHANRIMEDVYQGGRVEAAGNPVMERSELLRGNVPADDGGRGAMGEAILSPSELAVSKDDQKQLDNLAGNINLSYIKTTEAAEKTLREVARQAEGFMGARRGVVSHEQTAQLATELGISYSELMKRKSGQAFNAHELFAARALLLKSAERVSRLAKKVQTSTSAIDLAEFHNALTRHAAIQEQVAGAVAEAGRALNQQRMMAKSNYVKGLSALLEDAKHKNVTGPEAIKDIADKVAELDDPAKVGKFTHDLFRITVWDMVREIWINSLLSGLRTHATNILSNTFVALNQVPETAVASFIGRFHGGEKVEAGESMARLIGLMEGVKEGLQAAGKVIKTEEPADFNIRYDQPRKKAVPGRIGRAVRIPGTALMAADELFKAVNTRAEINALAFRMAMKEGLNGQALIDRIADLRNNPTVEMQDKAHEAALYNTFQSKLGPIGRWIMRGRDMIPGAWIVMPFVKTPMNILKYAIERTPFGLALSDVRDNLAGKNGNIARDTQMARMGLGTVISLGIASMALSGMISGGGPGDDDEKKVLRATGWQPYSIKIGDSWYSYQRLDPFGFQLGLVADMVELTEAMEDAEASKIGAMVITAISENVLNKTYLSGISDLIEALQDPGRYGDNYVRQLAGTLIPTGMAQVAQVIDPVQRDARSALDRIKSRVPWLSMSLPPRRNIFGEEIKYDGSLGPDLVSPVFMSTEVNNPVAAAMKDANYYPSMPQRRINNHPLTPEQFDLYTKESGERAVKKLTPKATSTFWKNKTPDAKAKIIEKAFSDARDEAKTLVKNKWPELKKKPWPGK